MNKDKYVILSEMVTDNVINFDKLPKSELFDERTSTVFKGDKFPVLFAIEWHNRLYAWCHECLRWHVHGASGHKAAHCPSESPYMKCGYYVKKVADI